MTDRHQHHKSLLAPLRAALYEGGETEIRSALADILAPDCLIRLAHPFGDMTGPDSYWQQPCHSFMQHGPMSSAVNLS